MTSATALVTLRAVLTVTSATAREGVREEGWDARWGRARRASSTCAVLLSGRTQIGCGAPLRSTTPRRPETGEIRGGDLGQVGSEVEPDEIRGGIR